MTDSLQIPEVKLIRTTFRGDGTFGTVSINNIPVCISLERPWLDNRKGESCIPTGRYVARRVISPKFGNTFEVIGVEGRDAILFHAGNIVEDTHGCIVLGESFSLWDMTGQCSVASSKVALSEFLYLLSAVDKFSFSVFNYYS